MSVLGAVIQLVALALVVDSGVRRKHVGWYALAAVVGALAARQAFLVMSGAEGGGDPMSMLLGLLASALLLTGVVGLRMVLGLPGLPSAVLGLLGRVRGSGRGMFAAAIAAGFVVVVLVTWFGYERARSQYIDAAAEHALVRARSLAAFGEALKVDELTPDVLGAFGRTWRRTSAVDDGSYFTIVAAERRVVYSTSTEVPIGAQPAPLASDETPAAPVDVLLRAGNDAVGWQAVGNDDVLTAYTPSSVLGGMVGVHIPRRVLEARARSALAPWFGGVALIGFSMLGLSLVVAGRPRGPTPMIEPGGSDRVRWQSYLERLLHRRDDLVTVVSREGVVVYNVAGMRASPAPTPRRHDLSSTEWGTIDGDDASVDRGTDSVRLSTLLPSLRMVARSVVMQLEGQIADVAMRLELTARRVSQAERDELTAALDGLRRATALAGTVHAYADGHAFSPRLVDLDTMLDGLGPDLEATVGDRVRLTVLRASEPCYVRVDAGHVRWAIITLAAFARRRVAQSGALVVELDPVDLGTFDIPARSDLGPGPYVRLRVTDDGAGLSPRELADLFLADGQAEDRAPGLPTLYRVIRAHGGHVDVHSRSGRGTRFVIHLPRLSGPELESALELSARSQVD